MFATAMAWTAETLAASATIRFRATAMAQGAIITLGDIADISDGDTERAARLKAVQLVPAPVPGEALRLEFGIIRSRLQAQGFNLAELDFAGHSVVIVSPGQPAGVADATAPRLSTEPAEWKQDRAERLIAEAIREHCARRAPELGNVQVSVELQPRDIDRVITAGGQAVTVAEGRIPHGDPQPLMLRLGSHGRGEDLKVSASVTPWPWVLAANSELPSGHRVRLEDLAWIQVETSDELFTEVERLVGLETAQPIRAGRPVSADDVRMVPLIRSGDIVTVSSRRAGITVRRAMRSRSDGAAGEEITVTTLDGRERLTARVTGFHEAEVGAQSSTAPAGPQPGLRVITEAARVNVPGATAALSRMP